MEQYLGEMAALATAVCWSFGSLMFTYAGRRIGSYTVNHVRLWMAFFLMMIIHWLFLGSIFPVDAEGFRFLWLGLSGIVGYVLGDAMLFESFVRIGPRLAMLMMTLVPVFGAFLGWILLGEVLLPVEWIAIGVTLAGSGMVVSEHSEETGTRSPKSWVGVFFGIGGAAGQAVGLLLAKMGLANGFSAISANLIRVSAAALALGLLVSLRGHIRQQVRRLSDRRSLMFIFTASILGPVLGVILSLVSIAHAPIGIASTLMSLCPVLLLPISHYFLKEIITRRAVLGTVVAIIGASLFFLFD